MKIKFIALSVSILLSGSVAASINGSHDNTNSYSLNENKVSTNREEEELISSLRDIFYDENTASRENKIKRMEKKYAYSLEYSSQGHNVVNVINEFHRLNNSMMYMNNYVSANGGNYYVDIPSTIQNGQPTATDAANALSMTFDHDEKFMQSAIELHTFFDNVHEHFDISEETGTLKQKDNDPTDANAINTLNTAFLIKALMEPPGSEASKQARVSYYVGLTTSSIAVVQDVASLNELVMNGLEYTNELTKSAGRIAGKISQGYGVISSLVTLGLDAWKLAEAKTPGEKALAGFSVGVDVVSTLSVVAELAGYSNPLAIPFLGLTKGTEAVIEAYSKMYAKQRVYMDMIGDTYKSYETPYTFSYDEEHSKPKMWTPHELAVITKLDLLNGEFTMGSNYVTGTKGGSGHTYSGGWDHFFSAPDSDSKKILDILPVFDQSLKGDHVYSFDQFQTEQMNSSDDSFENAIIVLPYAAPRIYKNVIKKQAEGIRYKKDDGANALRKIRNHYGRDFYWAFYAPPTDYMFFVSEKSPYTYKNNNIKIQLSDKNHTLVVPGLVNKLKQHVSYTINGNGGNYNVISNVDQPSVTINTSADDTWIFDLSSYINVTKENVDRYEHVDIIAQALNSIRLTSDGRYQIKNKEVAKFNFSEGERPNIAFRIQIADTDTSITFTLANDTLIGLRADHVLTQSRREAASTEFLVEEIAEKSKMDMSRFSAITFHPTSDCDERHMSNQAFKLCSEDWQMYFDYQNKKYVRILNKKNLLITTDGLVYDSEEDSDEYLPPKDNWLEAQFEREITGVKFESSQVYVTVNLPNSSNSDGQANQLIYKMKFNEELALASHFNELADDGIIGKIIDSKDLMDYDNFIEMLGLDYEEMFNENVRFGPRYFEEEYHYEPEVEKEFFTTPLIVNVNSDFGTGTVRYKMSPGQDAILENAIVKLEDKNTKVDIYSNVAIFKHDDLNNSDTVVEPLTINAHEYIELIKNHDVFESVFQLYNSNKASLTFKNLSEELNIQDNIFVTYGENDTIHLVIDQDSSQFHVRGTEGGDLAITFIGDTSTSSPIFKNLILSEAFSKSSIKNTDNVVIEFKDVSFSLKDYIH